jgi:multidrug efflux system outer membrane protein
MSAPKSLNMPYAHTRALSKRIGKVVVALMTGFGLALSSGCTVGPNFQRPAVKVPAQWTGPEVSPMAAAVSPPGADLTRWWERFQDPTLSSLVERAIKSNLDLMVAEARVRQARATRGIAVAGIGPTVDTSASFQRNRSPVTGSGDRPKGVISNQYQAGFDAGWELDIFGGIRRNIEAADADVEASVETLRDVLVTLTAELARNYIELRSFQQRIVIARRNLKAQQHSADLTRQRFVGGFVGALDVANAEAQVATTAAEIPLLEAAARQSIYSLSVLLGLEPAALKEELSPVSAIPSAPPSVPTGVPSDLLRRRPDIRTAEAEIHGATARIGVATADLFPRFTISGSTGLVASDFSSWLKWASRFWSFGTFVTWPLFDMGRIRANIELQKALQEETMITYQQTVLGALQEVENAMVASEKEEEHRRALVEAVTANRKAVDLATKLYTQGETNFLDVLVAQRSLFSSEDALIQSTGTVSTNLVALYKALGGGWTDDSASVGNTGRD